MRWIGIASLFIAVVPTVAAAHDVGGTRFQTPIPLSLLFLGAGATVAVTAVWLGRTEETAPTEALPVGTTSKRTYRILRAGGRVGFATVLVVAVIRGIVGPQVAAENVATVFVWPLWLKGIGLLAILVGSPWRVLSPWRGIHALLEWVEADELGLVAYPSGWGIWPAVIGFVAVVGVVENLTVVPRSPRLTAGLVAAYTVAMVLGGVVFGRSWFRRADFLEVLYRQFGRVAPVRGHQRDGEYLMELRFPWTACTKPVVENGGVAFVVAMVYTVSFDGFTNTPEYQQVLFAVRDALGTGSGTQVLLYLVGLAGFVLSFIGAATLVELLGATELSIRAVARAFAPTVLPIAAAYELAHNYPFVLRNLAQLLELGLHAVGVETGPLSLLGWLSVPLFWGSQVLLVVLGHVIAVVAAHQVAVRRYNTLTRARRAHVPLVVVMAGYTVLSLWIISRPVVSG